MRKRMTRNPILFILITFVFTSWTQVSAAPRQTITAVFTVNSTLDIGDNNPGDGLCQTGPGGLFCSLRAAIEEANALPGHDTIQFNLGGSATMTFSPNPELPAITEPVTIDALTGVGTCPAGATPADLKVSINGAAATGNGASFNRGLLLAAGSDGSHIEGVVIGDFGSDPVVGGKGLQIESSDNIIRCNHIGVATDGTTPFGNDVGIELIGSRNVIGGNLARDRNVISGNDSQGIFVANGIGNEIYHNYIGTDAAGQPLGNGAEGILLTDGSETRMGDDGKGNVIAHNGRTGIFSSLTSLGPLVMGNSIHSNGDLGFDRITTASLFPGVTPNDSAHPFYFFPNLTGAFPGGIITGTFDNFVDAGKNFYVHFYSSSSCDGSGHGEGETYLGFTAFTTDNNGFFSFTVNLGIPLTPGDQITATASRLADDLSEFEGGTSEFSACITVTDTTYTIDTTTTLADSNPGDGVCDVIGPNTFCSLRAAIEEVNTQTGGPFLLQFDLGAGGGTIQPNTPLPTITAPVVLDGTIAQTGATCASTNTPARLLVVLDGSNLSSGSGLVLDTGSSSSTIQGLNIINFPDHGVEVNSNNNRLKCNYIGFESNSLGSAGNGSDGVYISGDNNELGGASLANQNVISGNGGSGVFIVASSDNKLKGNLIGLAKDGLSTLPNSGSGVRLNDGDNNQIGGTAAEGNIISGNDVYGINLHNGSNDNVIQANYIGTGQNLFVGLGNGSAGIRLDSSSDNSIGGTSSELGNIISDNGGNGILIANVSNTTLVQHNRIGVNANGTALPNDLNGVRINNSSRNSLVDNWIAYNSGDGINVTDTSQRNEIHRNNIHDNGLMGIDLDDDDVTNVNDPTDGDSGGNGLQNYPVIDTASIQTGVIEGQLLGPASTSFQIDFFRGDSCDPSGFGEGEVYLGTHAFSSDNSNEFTASNITGFGWGDYLTATATDDLNNTSEFSICFQCNEPLLMNLTISNNSGNIELLIIGNQNEDEFLIYRSINDPYFTPSTSYDQIIGNLWADGDNDEIGNVAENHFYLVRGQNECGYGGDSKRVGEFDFEIVPGS